MRIITGSARGTRLSTPAGDDITRPTSEKVKEAVFSMIQFDLEGRSVLDLFAGTGQMGLEALSRGASKAVFCDTSSEAVELIKDNARKTHLFESCRVLRTDYKELVRSFRGREKFDIVFLDPPYRSGFAPDALKKLSEAELLTDGALVICETDSPEPITYDGFTVKRFNRYGIVYITLLEKERTDID